VLRWSERLKGANLCVWQRPTLLGLCRLGAPSYTFKDDHARIVGTAESSGAQLLVDHLGLSCSAEQLLEKRDEHLGEGFVTASPLPGAVALVGAAHREFGEKTFIATSSSREYLSSKVCGSEDKHSLFHWFFPAGGLSAVRVGDAVPAGGGGA
jgi:hypothetical protein